MAAAASRPFGVTLVAIIALVNGILNILAGALPLLGMQPGDPTVSWITLVIGILTVLVSVGLFRGNNVARILVAIIFVLNVVGGIAAIVQFGLSWSAVTQIALPVIGLALLFSSKANAYFR